MCVGRGLDRRRPSAWVQGFIRELTTSAIEDDAMDLLDELVLVRSTHKLLISARIGGRVAPGGGAAFPPAGGGDGILGCFCCAFSWFPFLFLS